MGKVALTQIQLLHVVAHRLVWRICREKEDASGKSYTSNEIPDHEVCWEETAIVWTHSKSDKENMENIRMW